MWTQLPLTETPPELAPVTTSLWEYEGLIRVGVIRGRTFLVPPYLWAEVIRPSFGALRKSRKLLDELQAQLKMPLVFAETDPEMPANTDFLQFVGFELISTAGPRNLFKRSIF